MAKVWSMAESMIVLSILPARRLGLIFVSADSSFVCGSLNSTRLPYESLQKAAQWVRSFSPSWMIGARLAGYLRISSVWMRTSWTMKRLDLLKGGRRLIFAPQKSILYAYSFSRSAIASLARKQVTGRIDGVLNELDSEALADNSRFVLAVRLGQTSRLSTTLNAVSNDAFDTDNVESQVDFVRADLETGATLVRTGRGDLLLMTETLVYDLQPLRAAGADETWNVASCNNARLRDKVRLGRRETVAVPAHRIEIVRFASRAKSRGMAPSGDGDRAIRRGRRQAITRG